MSAGTRVRPITPKEAKASKCSAIPDVVFEVVNAILTARGPGDITQKEVVDAILAKLPTATREGIFASGWLDFEPAYRKAGWSVKYDKPGYNEDYQAYWTFEEMRR